jgi:hypothetical protein
MADLAVHFHFRDSATMGRAAKRVRDAASDRLAGFFSNRETDSRQGVEKRRRLAEIELNRTVPLHCKQEKS